MKKKLLLCVSAVMLLTLIFVSCQGKQADGAAQASGKLKIYFIPKNLGNPYFEALSKGFRDAIGELGEDKFEYIFTGPATPEATSQIEYVEAAVQNGAFAIFIAANSNDALNGTFDDARAEGVRIYIINQDIPGSESHRDAAIMPVNFDTIGVAQMDLLYDQIGGAGEFAILSATTDAPDQNTWVDLMKGEVANTPKYGQMKLVEVVYGDDQPAKSTTEMEALLTKYPNLKGVIAPTTVGIAAAAKVVQTRGVADKVKITGLGLPSEMAEFVLDGTVLGFQLWNPPYEGYLGVYMVNAEVNEGFKPAPGASFNAGKLGQRTILPNGQILTLETPMLYEKGNIEEYAALF
jgi:rhamnose transport system substrate-binding protein